MDLNAALVAQGLDASDLDANRAGKVTEKQLERQRTVRRNGGLGVWLMALVSLLGCGAVAVVKGVLAHDTALTVTMGVMGVVGAALPLGVYFTFRFADPAKVARCTVQRLENAKMLGLLVSARRGVYTINLDGKLYSGFASQLGPEHLGERVNAYVVAEHKLVVALEPMS